MRVLVYAATGQMALDFSAMQLLAEVALLTNNCNLFCAAFSVSTLVKFYTAKSRRNQETLYKEDMCDCVRVRSEEERTQRNESRTKR